MAPLQTREVALVVAGVLSTWSIGLLSLQALARPPAGRASGFWGTLPSDWDHPEPNYLVSPVVGEFWSVLTTIPVAGALLLQQGIRFGYGPKVMVIYGLTCGMYTLACSAHLTLQRHIFSTTVTAVMSNALLTFVMFSHVVHAALESMLLRGLIVVLSEVLLVTTVGYLPYRIQHGGVWTLFIVQAPGVFLATALAFVMASRAKRKEEKTTYQLVSLSGSLLSSAMVLSFVECLIGFQWGFLESFWGFPYLHVAIHLLEQFGIYVFGVGAAALEVMLLRPKDFQSTEVRCLGLMPYLYCEVKQSADSATRSSRGSELLETKTQVKGTPEARDVEATNGQVRAETTVQRKKRTQSPGVAPKHPGG